MAGQLWAQKYDKFARDRAEEMLAQISADVHKHYFDPKFHGLDWDAKTMETKQRIEQSSSFGGAMSAIAALLDELNDSHTFFLPPEHDYWNDYGWHFEMVGEHCFVTRVRPKSDAEAKNLKPGDEVLSIGGFPPNRLDAWKIYYLIKVLRPQPVLRVQLKDPAGMTRQVDVAAKVKQKKHTIDLTGANEASDVWQLIREGEGDEHRNRARSEELGDDLMILKFPVFDFSASEIGSMIGRAKKHKGLIIDLRGNGGGAEETMKLLVASMLDKEVKIADRVKRKDIKPLETKAWHGPFTGKLVVLTDSESGSASELFARVMQLEKRGSVIGDVSSGSVMEARHYSEKSGADTVVFYGASITEADLIMTDGKSLEHSGVKPDELVLPTAEDLAAGRDPVLARAAQTLGVKITAEDAGKLFPYEWAPDE